MKLSIFVLLLAILDSASAGKIYRWIDNSGQVHYTDRPPVGEPYAALPVTPLPMKGASAERGGIRAGEFDLLKQSASREADLLRSRKAASRAYTARSRRCDKAKVRYNDALRDSISGGEAERERVKDYYAALKTACRY